MRIFKERGKLCGWENIVGALPLAGKVGRDSVPRQGAGLPPRHRQLIWKGRREGRDARGRGEPRWGLSFDYFHFLTEIGNKVLSCE